MLTLREPIKLNISDSLCTMTDAFYERIAGTYGAMQADITPKELLFCLSTPYELPDELGGMTTVAVSNRYTDKRNVTMELVSNVLNRIMLSTTPQFTYQDQVYIDSVLYKLGVEDVPLFMQQVQKLTDEHLSVERLLSLYREELTQRAAQSLPGESAAPKPKEIAAAAETPSDRPRYFLQNEIYDRLQTKELYKLVNSLQTDYSRSFSTFRQNELKTAEHLSVSRLLELTELRERVTEVPRLTLHHTVNRFELGDLLPAPQTSEQVLSQAAEAALLSSFDHIFTQSLVDRVERAPFWLRLERSLSETVENSVSRFQNFHSADSFFFTDSVREPAGLERFREESSILRELVQSRTELTGAMELTRRLQESNVLPPLELRHPPIEAEGELLEEPGTERLEKETELRREKDISSLTREILERGAVPAPMETKPAPPEPVPVERTFRTVREIELASEVESRTERLRETLERQRIETVEAVPADYGPAESIQTVEQTLRELREHTERTAEQRRTETVRETAMQNPPASPAETAGEAALPGAPRTAAQPAAETPAGPGTVPPAGETPAQALERELREVNERNREHFEALQIEHLHTTETQTPVEDRRKTLEISKRALESPETVLRELRESAENGAKPGALSPEAALRLQHADPETRAILEAALRRESGEGAGQPGPQFREGSPGQINAAALESLRSLEPAPEAEFSAVEKTLAEEHTRTLLERIAEPAAAAAVSQFAPAPPKKLSLIHKREQEFLSDELLEQLQNRQTSRTQETETFETQTDRRIEEFSKTGTTTRLTAETQEDVTELVNRTLARQMNEISDKVYRQMEKRLQSERSRRGRF